MDLIGIPIRITIGKKFSEGLVELKLRNEESFKEVPVNELISHIDKIINEWFRSFFFMKNF